MLHSGSTDLGEMTLQFTMKLEYWKTNFEKNTSLNFCCKRSSSKSTDALGWVVGSAKKAY